jgi:hypothetical protein
MQTGHRQAGARAALKSIFRRNEKSNHKGGVLMVHRIAIPLLATAALIPAQQIVGDPGFGPSGIANREIYNRHRATRSRSNPTTQAENPEVVVLIGDTIIPQLVDGGGWKTTFKFINLNNYPVTFKLLFFSDTGGDLTLPILGVGAVINLTITLPIAGSIDAQTAGISNALSQGWAYMLQQSPNDSIGGFAIFRQRVPGVPDQEAAVPIVNQFDNHFALLYDNTAFATGIAIANASPTNPVAIPVNIRDQTGSIIDTRIISLGPDSHTAFVLSSLWPSTADRQGVIEFLVSGLGVGALGLRFNGAAFTSFPILSNFSWIVPQ